MSKINAQFIKPRYDEGGFAGIPGRITGAFESGNYDAVVLFLVDAFGWRFYERFQDAPFIKRVAKHGRIEKLTSQFPSTTAAHLTTIHTGWNVGQSGVHEWIYYEPQLDAIIAPLLFSYSGGSKTRDARTHGDLPDGSGSIVIHGPRAREFARSGGGGNCHPDAALPRGISGWESITHPEIPPSKARSG